MSNAIRFVVPGVPVAKARARTVRMKSGFVHSYTPKKTVLYESQVRLYFTLAHPKFVPLEGAVELTVWAYFPVPKCSKSKDAVDHEEVKHTKIGDWDNHGKAISDALNGVAWMDDKQVSDAHVHKRYSKDPRVVVEIQGE